MNETARLAHIRDQLHAIEPGDWTRAHEGTACLVEGRSEFGQRAVIARFGPHATDAEIAFVVDAALNVRFLLGLVDRAIRAMRPAGEAAEAAAQSKLLKDYAAEAAMKCAEPAFKRFLFERHGLEQPLTDDRTAQKLRSLLGVASRRELNDDDTAAARWKQLRGDFEHWKRAG